MNFLDAAYEVLLEAQEPLDSQTITTIALEKDLLNTNGLTPAATMASALNVDTKKENSRFIKIKKGIFSLKEQPSKEIVRQIDSININVRKHLKDKLHRMNPKQFEDFIGELLLKLGFQSDNTGVTKYANDGGVDFRGVLNVAGVSQVDVAVQVKRWKNNAQRPTVQGLRGALNVHEQGIIITTSSFSKGAREDAIEPGRARISLIDGEQLLDLLFEQEMGVTAEKHFIYSLDEGFGDSLQSEEETITTSEEELTSIQYPVKIKGWVHGEEREALLLNANGETQYQDKTYPSPSGAGEVAAGWKSCNGWLFWKCRHPVTNNWQSIEALRPSDT